MARGLRNISILAAIVFIICAFGALYFFEGYLGQDLRSKFGFATGSPYSKETGEVLTIERVYGGRPFANAGVRENDIILDYGTLTFYAALSGLDLGETFTFRVASFDEPGALDERPVREVHVTCPQ